jgi:hypothetical protein
MRCSQIVCVLTLSLAAGFCSPRMHAQDEPAIPAVVIPRLPGVGHSAADFAPHGWTVQLQAAGDLNGDGRPDLAFVLHDTDPHNVLKSSGMGVDSMDTNPRIFGVAFRDATGDGYTLALQNSTFIPRYTEPTQDDNFGDEGGLWIKRGAITLALHYFSNAGGWDAGSATFTFRYQHARFELIGAEQLNHARNTGTDTTTSINYSTGVVLITTTSDAGATHVQRRTLAHAPPKVISTMEDGMDFEFPE